MSKQQLFVSYCAVNERVKQKRIPRTFVFDRNIQAADYKKYINEEDLVDEELEEMKKIFINYRTTSRDEILSEK